MYWLQVYPLKQHIPNSLTPKALETTILAGYHEFDFLDSIYKWYHAVVYFTHLA